MKKLISLCLAVFLMLASVPCMAEEEIATISLNFFQVTASFTTPKNVGQLTARITNTDGNDHKIYAVDQKNGKKTDDGYLYTFAFLFPQTADSGTYLLSVGGAYGFTQEFSYYNIMEKVEFYNALNQAPVTSEDKTTISEMLSGEDCKVGYDFKLYKSLMEEVRVLVDAAVDELDLSATKETVAEKEILLTELLDSVIPLAVLMNVSDKTEKETLDSLVEMGKKAGVLDDKGYSDLPYEYVLTYLIQEIPDTLDEKEVSEAFSRAVLLATVEALDAYSICEIFDYYLEKGIVSVNEDDYEAIQKDDAEEALFESVKKKDNGDIDTLEKHINKLMEDMLEEDEPSGSGTSGGGASSGGGGSSRPSSGGGGFRPANGNAGFSGDAQSKVEEDAKSPVTFSDLESCYWAKPAIEALATEGILSGRGEQVFAPDEPMSREELVKLIILAFEGYDKTAVASFDDVATDRWSYPYIASANSLGLVKGVSATLFAPEALVSRQDMATILYRVLEKTGDAQKGNAVFSDYNEISDYAKEAVEALVAIGAVSGMGDGSFAPKANVTRAQAAKVVYEMMRYVGGDAK